MEVLRVFSNNVVLARDQSAREVVLTGRGVGFGVRPGDSVDEARISRTFVPTDGRDPDNYGLQIADIPPEHLALADEALASVSEKLLHASLPSLVVALADHLSFAIKRQRQDMALEYPLRSEISYLYPRELALAQQMMDVVNSHLSPPLPTDEAIPIALHLVNAGFATGDLSQTYQMTGVLKQIFGVIGTAYNRTFDTDTVHAARFVTHMRYFFVRLHAGTQLDEGHMTFHSAIREAYPDAYQCGLRLKAILELRLGQPVTEDEVTYLTMHVARLADDERGREAAKDVDDGSKVVGLVDPEG